MSPLLTAEKALLLLVLAFLPSFEAPKNIALVAYLVVWAIGRAKDKDCLSAWDRWDTWMSLFILAAYASTVLGAFPADKGIASAHHVALMGFTFMAVRRNRYDDRFMWAAFITAIAATIATLAYGYWGLLVTHQRTSLGLNSVGHVNHSAIYMGIVFAMAFACTVASGLSHRAKCLAVLSTAILAISIFVSSARGTIIPVVLFTGIWLAATPLTGKKKLAISAIMLVIISTALVFIPGVMEKTRGGLDSQQVSSYRVALAKTSLVAAAEYPILGVGLSNFKKITPEKIDEWQQSGKTQFSQDQLFYAPHAHNLYANTLAETGLSGLLPLLLLFGSIGVALIRRKPKNNDAQPLYQVLWCSALGAGVVTAVGGLFNTTLHHEHALITVIIVGLWSSRTSLNSN